MIVGHTVIAFVHPDKLVGTNQKIKAANFLAAVVADLLHNFNGPSGQESAYYNQSRYEILFPQICRLPLSANKFEAQ
jgi:hypothetical protein